MGAQPGAPPVLKDLCEGSIRANAKAEQALVEQWLKLAKEAKDWRGIHKYMACRWPQRWSEKRLLEVSAPTTVAPIKRRELNLDGMSRQEIRDLRDGLARVLGIEGTP